MKSPAKFTVANRNRLFLVGMMMACAFVHADTYYWLGLKTAQEAGRTGYSGYAYRCKDNWYHLESGLCDSWPQDGDTMAVSDVATNWVANAVPSRGFGNEFGEYGLGELVYERAHSTGSGDVGLLAGGRGTRFGAQFRGAIWWNSQMKVFGAGDVIVDVPDGSSIDSNLSIKPAPGQESNSSVFVKRGPGRFTAFSDGGWASNARRFINGLRLEGGTFAINAACNATDTGTENGNSIYQNIDLTFAGGSNEVLRIGTDFYTLDHVGAGAQGYSWHLRDSALYETPCAVNMPHRIESAGRCRLGFFGTPKTNPMRFTGTFELSAGLLWSPDSSDKVFELAYGASSTTGDVVVKNGTVKVTDGARLVGLSAITVDGAGAVFEVGETGGTLYPRATLELSSGGRVRVPAGMTMQVLSARVGGNDLAAGTILRGGESEWVLGAGSVYVIGEDNTGTYETAAWDTTGKPDTLANSLANWPGRTVLPDLSGGTTYVEARSGSTGFTVPQDMKFMGFDLTGVSEFQLLSQSSTSLGIGSRGITGSNGRYQVTADMTLTADQRWHFDNQADVSLYRPLQVRGASSLALTGTDVTYRVSGDLGPRGFRVDIDNSSKVRFPENVTINADVHVFNPEVGKTAPRDNSRFLNPIGNVTFNGRVTFEWNTAGFVTVDPGAYVTFNEDVVAHGRPFKYETASGTTTRFNKRLLVLHRTMFWTPASTIELNARGNCLGYAASWSAESFSRGTIRLLVPYALEDRAVTPGLFKSMYGQVVMASTMSMGVLAMNGTATLDMCGNDQSLRTFVGRGGEIVSASDAMMTLRPVDDWDGASLDPRKDKTSWGGGVGLRYEAGVENWPHFMYKASSTTGRLEVARGRLVFLRAGGSSDPYNIAMEGYSPADRPDSPASWRNCSSVTLSGGSLELEHGEVFGDMTDVYVEGTGGKIKLDAGVVQCVRSLYVDGVLQKRGRWGSSSSPVDRKHQNDALFTGSGVLRVLSGEMSDGMEIIFR